MQVQLGTSLHQDKMKNKIGFILIFILLLTILPFISGTISGSVYSVGSAALSVQGSNASGVVYAATTYLTPNTGGSENGSVYSGNAGFFGQFESSTVSFYYVTINQTSPVQAGDVYSVIIDITNSSSDTLITSAPEITLYDSLNNLIVSNAVSTSISAKEYQYNFTTLSNYTAGTWQTNISVGINGNTEKYAVNWTLLNEQTAVSINNINVASSPTINANVTITNEGNSDYEYLYSYCIVSDFTQQCGAPGNVAYASGSKLIDVGQSFNPILSLNIAQSGSYWFKVVVSYGALQSGASEIFSAVVPITSAAPPTTTSTSSGASSPVTVITPAPPITGAVITPPTQPLLMVDTKILDNYKTVKPGDKVLMQVNIYNVGAGEVNNAVINYCIKGSDEKVIECTNETVNVNTETQLVKEFLIPANFKPGEYYINTEVDYNGKSASSEDSFEVKGSILIAPENFVTKNLLPIILGIIILILLMALIFKKKGKGAIKPRITLSKQRPMPLETIEIEGGRYVKIKPKSYDNIKNQKVVHFKAQASGKNILLRLTTLLGGLWSKNEKYSVNSVLGLINKKVYSSSGNYIGKVNDVIFEGNKIHSLKIKLNQEGRGVIIGYGHTRNVGEIIIIEGDINFKGL